MTGLTIALHENGGPGRLAGAVARVVDLAMVDDDPGRATSDHAVSSATPTYDLPTGPGRYHVQLILPNGKVLSHVATVTEGESARIDFSLETAAPQPASPATARAPKRTARAKRYSKAGAAAATVRGAAAEAAFGTRTVGGAITAIGGAVAAAIGASIGRLTSGGGAASSAKNPAPPARIIELAPGVVARRRSKGAPPPAGIRLLDQDPRAARALWPTFAQGDAAGWRRAPIAAEPTEPGAGGSRVLHQTLEVEDTAMVGVRRWALADLGDEVQLASLPLPWQDAEQCRPIPVEVHRSDSGDEPAGLRARVPDPHLTGLLRLLGHGRLAVARPVIEAMENERIIERVICLKAGNPLGACGAAYVGLAVFRPGERECWDGWLPNLWQRFPWLPDGAILHARRIVLRPRDRAETGEILPALKDAYRAGIPYYSAGLLLMREMLTVCVRDEEAEEMLDNVTRVTNRLVADEVFTVLRYSTLS